MKDLAPSALEHFVALVDERAPAARNAADQGDASFLRRIEGESAREAGVDRTLGDEGAIREARIQWPSLGERLDRIIAHDWAHEGAVRAELATRVVRVGPEERSLDLAFLGCLAPDPDERAASAEAVERSVADDDWLETLPDPRPVAADRKSSGGIILLGAPETAAEPAPKPTWSWTQLAPLSHALRDAVNERLPVRIAARGLSVADFRPTAKARAGLPWMGAVAPFGRGGRLVESGPEADRNAAAVLALGSDPARGVARILAACSPRGVAAFVADAPRRALPPARALALALTSLLLDDLLAAHADDAEELANLVHMADPLDEGPGPELARIWMGHRRLAALPSESGLYRFGGGPLAAAAARGLSAAIALRERYDEDWYANPRASDEAIAGVVGRAEPSPASAWVAFLSEQLEL